MKRQHSTTPTPDRILAAADRIVLRDGVRRLTLEAVAGNRRQNRQHLLGG
jgi:AcrR family transcriptional regulator